MGNGRETRLNREKSGRRKRSIGNRMIVSAVLIADVIVVCFMILIFLKEKACREEEASVTNPVVIVLEEKVEEKTEAVESGEKLTDEEIMARVVMTEAGIEPMIGKVAVAATILNRAELWDKSVLEVVSQKYQYIYPYSGVVNSDCYEAVKIAQNERKLFPQTMIYFRTEHYHEYGKPYIQIGAHYFSIEETEGGN